MNPIVGAWPELDAADRRLHIGKQERENSGFARVASVFADLKSSPDADATLDAQVLHGEKVRVLGRAGEWTRIATQMRSTNDHWTDHYVGWVETGFLQTDSGEPTHHVTAPRTFIYPSADMKLPRTGYRSMGSLVTVTGEAETRGTRYAMLASGDAVVAGHVALVSTTSPDYVAVAETLIHTPYLWGGNTGFGLDCSGLVQLSMRMAGRHVMRDTDMQAATIGEPVDIASDWQNLKRGDLVFWRGHVAIAQGMINGEAYLIHANGHTMDVTSEPASVAVDRIAHLYEQPIGVRRP